MIDEKQFTITLTYSEIMALVDAADYKAERLQDMADMTNSKEKAKAMREESVEFSLLAGKLMKLSTTDM